MSDMAPATTITTAEPAGEIDWHVEQRGAGPDLVLIPSGEGDCSSFDRLANDLSRDFRVTTFDTPSFSRTNVRGTVEISMVALGRQVASLIVALGLETPTVYGCSSAGLATLDLAVDHPGLVGQVVVHEVALPREVDDPRLLQIAALDDVGIAAACAKLFETWMNEDEAAWRALGPEYHQRLSANYPTWIHRYVAGPKHRPFDPTSLEGKPITWTIGGLFEVRAFFSNVLLAGQAGLAIDMLPCKHFPQVSIPALLATHIRDAAVKGDLR